MGGSVGEHQLQMASRAARSVPEEVFRIGLSQCVVHSPHLDQVPGGAPDLDGLWQAADEQELPEALHGQVVQAVLDAGGIPERLSEIVC